MITHTTLSFQEAVSEGFSSAQFILLSCLVLTLVIVCVFIIVIVHCMWTYLVIRLFCNYSLLISLIFHLEKKINKTLYIAGSASCVAVAAF